MSKVIQEFALRCFGASLVSLVPLTLVQSSAKTPPPTTTTTTMCEGAETTLSRGKNNTTETQDHLKDNPEFFQKHVPSRQLYTPKLPYPAWDYNWDKKETPLTSLDAQRVGIQQGIPGKTRHILLVRHGQYDESSQEDALRKLTPLGQVQATKTGKRLAEIMKGTKNFAADEYNGRNKVVAIRTSNMLRAKETAELIAKEMEMKVEAPDAGLNEALPAPMIPVRPDIDAEKEIDDHHDRIEDAFQRYFYRDDSVQDEEDEEEDKNEFEVIVCHGNVIRYFFLRALQLPPESWLRLSTFNCSITYLRINPNGTVSCRMMGDIGHLPYEETSFSGYHGFRF